MNVNDIENLCLSFDRQTNLEIEEENSLKKRNDRQQRSLNISTLSHYFSLQCGQFLRLYVGNSIDKTYVDNLRSSLTKQRGIDFEKKLKDFYSTSILNEIQDEKSFLSFLRQSIDKNNDELKIGYNIRFQWRFDQHITSHYRPDFLLVRHVRTDQNRIEITVVDAKSSQRINIEHCVQVALYAIDLRIWIEQNQLDQQVFINDFGQIWLPIDQQQHENARPHQIKTFPLRKLQKRLEDFLRNDLDRILQESDWMMLPRCSLCSFSSHCRKQVRENQSTSMNHLSYLTRSTHVLVNSILHSSSSSSLLSIDLSRLFSDSSTNERISSDEKFKLKKFFLTNKSNRQSSTIDALRTQKPQLKIQSSSLIPKFHPDLHLLFLISIPNPSELHSISLFAFNIYKVQQCSWVYSQPKIQRSPSPSTLVSSIIQALNELRSIKRSPCQIILFDEQEKSVLFEQITLASDHPQINQCLVLLNGSENAILIDPPPDIAQTDRIFRSHPLSNISKADLEEEFQHYYSFNEETTIKNLTKIQLTQQLKELNEQVQEESRKILVALPYLISLHSVIRQSFVVPIPGYFDLEDLKSSFEIDLPSPTINDLLDSLQSSSQSFITLVQQRFEVLARLYTILQKTFHQSNSIQLDAFPLPEIHPIRHADAHIRRLIFLRQYEMLHGLRTYQQSRFESTESPILIRVMKKIPIDKYHCTWQCRVELGEEIISKNLSENNQNDKDFRTYPYLIFEDISSILTFADALYMDTAVEYARSRIRFDHIGFVHVERDEDPSMISMRMKFSNLSLQIGQIYGLTERYIDFNTKKAIEALESATSLTMDILNNPRKLDKPYSIQQTSAEFQLEISNMFSKREPSIRPAGLHLLNKSQQNACEQVKNERLTLIWGPPGTGKTYWSAVTVFQILMFSASPLRILITACTHTAIDNLLASIDQVKTLFISSSQFPRWCQLAREILLLKLDSNNLRQVTTSKTKGSIIVGSTVWKLQKLDNSVTFDVIFVDEATQLLMSDAVLALNRLANHRESRLIVAGDPLQLPPIKQCNYPPLPDPTPDLFSSLFHCLLRDEKNRPISLESEKPFEDISRCPYLSIFNENHRMNEQLSDFTRLLYGEPYRQGRTKPLLSIRSDNLRKNYLLGSLLDPYSSLYTILVDTPLSSTITRSVDIQLESNLVLLLVEELIVRIHPTSIFLVTPHRLQRTAIRQKLSTRSFDNVSIICDTVERMQGKEAQCVILCMLYRQRDLLENELDFIFNRHRINVSITRAQQLCILLTSTLLINQPPLQLFINGTTRNAYSLLSNYYNKSTIRSLDQNGSIRVNM